MESRKPSNNNNNNNNNAIANNGKVPSLSDLAFYTFFRTSIQFDFVIEPSYSSIIENPRSKLFLDFLRAIANADPKAVKDFLDDCPKLAVIARGTVTGASGYTYEDVSAIELAYLMDDVELMEVLFLAIQKLSKEMIEDANTQLVNKMTEVKEQLAQFKPYDFSEMVNAFANDNILENTGQPNKATQIALEKFKEDFKPGNIKQGKSLIKEQMQEAYRVFDANWDSWDGNKLVWYLINVVGPIQALVETCFEQECSQGLNSIVEKKEKNARSVEIKNRFNGKPITSLTYRGTADSSLVLGRDFFVEIIGGTACGLVLPMGPVRTLKNYVEQKHQDFQKLSSGCNPTPSFTK